MGKASRWFRSLLGLKKSSDHSIPPKEKRRWSFVNSYRGGSSSASVMARQNPDANERAEVVRLTSSGRSAGECSPAYVSGSLGIRQDFAALKIQSAFRRYLARRALKALRSIVKIQALVRGHIVRKKTAAWLPQSSAASSRGGKRSPFMKIDQRAQGHRIEVADAVEVVPRQMLL